MRGLNEASGREKAHRTRFLSGTSKGDGTVIERKTNKWLELGLNNEKKSKKKLVKHESLVDNDDDDETEKFSSSEQRGSEGDFGFGNF